MKVTTLIVEDDDGLRSSLKKSFERRGHQVLDAATCLAASALVQERRVDLILLDIRLPDGSGTDVLAEARDLDEEVMVVMMTAFPEVKTAVDAIKAGAWDFVIKPFELEDLHLTVERALESRDLRRHLRRIEHERRGRGEVTEILGESPAIARVREEICLVAVANSPVLIAGETGSGKELVADAIHGLSLRSDGPFVKQNCSAFSEQLLESELFGHEKGAFTDARQARAGLFEMANGGTLLLDEISEMRPDLQAKLLRVVEGQPFRRLGGRREIHTDVRVVASTNRDLAARIRTGEFREDLYFRLKVLQIDVPPLRARGNDITLLARFFLRRSAADLRKSPMRLTPKAEEILLAYSWPGNVRELRNVMERAAIMNEKESVDVQHLPAELQTAHFVRRQTAGGSSGMPSLGEVERRYVSQVVESVGGNLSKAARILGIARNTLKAKLGG